MFFFFFVFFFFFFFGRNPKKGTPTRSCLYKWRLLGSMLICRAPCSCRKVLLAAAHFGRSLVRTTAGLTEKRVHKKGGLINIPFGPQMRMGNFSHVVEASSIFVLWIFPHGHPMFSGPFDQPPHHPPGRSARIPSFRPFGPLA